MQPSIRSVARRFRGQPTLEGAGVRLQRMFGNHEVPLLDPFLLLDNFGSTNPADYLRGFPWHPHRGMQTVTYMMSGETDHEDSLGNKGRIGTGEVQWMSAGSGILHQEMPRRTDGLLSGFQLWINLPRGHKMDTPSYRGVTSAMIPVVKGDDGSVVKVIAGRHGGAEGPVKGIPVVDPTYLDVTLRPGEKFRLATRPGDTAFAQVVRGRAHFDPQGAPTVGEPGPLYAKPTSPADDCLFGPGETAVYGPGDAVQVQAGEEGVQFIFAAGTPLHEPVAWYGPIVMNTREEILRAVRDLDEGTFIRGRAVNEL
jgi:redox-sensitive bicupin YhaK (pirin superfamily)